MQWSRKVWKPRPSARAKEIVFVTSFLWILSLECNVFSGFFSSPYCYLRQPIREARRLQLRASPTSANDYRRLTVQQLRELLKDRGLTRKGRKEDLVRKLERDDAGEIDHNSRQIAGRLKSGNVAVGSDVKLVRPGNTIYLQAHNRRRIDVEHDKVQARWTEKNSCQALTIEKSPLVLDNGDETMFRSGDLVFVKAHTGNYLDVDGDAVSARWEDQNHGMKWQGLVIVKHDSGPLMVGDTVYLQSHGGTYIDVQDSAVRARWEDEGDWPLLVEK